MRLILGICCAWAGRARKVQIKALVGIASSTSAAATRASFIESSPVLSPYNTAPAAQPSAPQIWSDWQDFGSCMQSSRMGPEFGAAPGADPLPKRPSQGRRIVAQLWHFQERAGFPSA